MGRHMTRTLVPFLQKHDSHPLAHAKFKLTMIPSVGFFIVAPADSIAFACDEKPIEEAESRISELANSLGWKFCF